MTDELDLAYFDYSYPPELIANQPAQPRDGSRLLYLPAQGNPQHLYFRDILRFIRPGDLLVLNETRVVKARFHAHRIPSGGKVEILLLGPAPEDPTAYRVLAKPARRMKPGSELRIGPYFLKVLDAGLVRFLDGVDPYTLCETYGEMPLPPYIEAPPELDVDQAYQPVFARVDGSVAAPTASLHFSEEILAAAAQNDVEIAKLVLEVGLGTFAPVRGTTLRDHVMHEEHFSIPPETARAIARTRARRGRVIAVGTTVVRALETAADGRGGVTAQTATTRAFITPGYEFQVVDALVTNFHVPKSTLLALVSAFAGRERILAAYREAVELRYRLFSFGDAMFLEHAVFRGENIS